LPAEPDDESAAEEPIRGMYQPVDVTWTRRGGRLCQFGELAELGVEDPGVKN